MSSFVGNASDKRIIQQEVDDADIENAVVVIPTLADVMTHDHLREGIAGQRKRLVFVMAFSSVPSA